MIREPVGLPVLIECGFIDNVEDVKILGGSIDLIGLGIVKGIIQYLGMNQKGFLKMYPKAIGHMKALKS